MGSKILVAGSHADNLGYQCDCWRIRWQGLVRMKTQQVCSSYGLIIWCKYKKDKDSISSLSTRGGKIGGLGKLVTSQNSGEMSFRVLTKIDLMDKGTDVIDWEKSYYISSIADANNGSSLCGHVKRNLIFITILQNIVEVLSCLVMLLGFTDQLTHYEHEKIYKFMKIQKIFVQPPSVFVVVAASPSANWHSPNRSIERVAPDERMGQLPSQQSDNVNPSGCARTGMSFIFVFVYRDNRCRKEPEALAATSLKRVYVENRPYLVGGFCQHDTLANINKNLMLDAESIVSMSENLATVLVVEENVKTGEKQASLEVANLKARSSAVEARLTTAHEQTLSAQEEAGEWKRKYDVAVKEEKRD
nr:histone-lysine N-methyltransferase ATX1 [Tanacetum cinerariifolium]